MCVAKNAPDAPSGALSKMARLGRIVTWAILGALLATAVRPVWSIDPDASAYVELARSMAAGEGYLLDALPHAKYPPGLPALFALLISWSGPEAYGLLHMGLVAALMAAVALTWALARRCALSLDAAFVVAACVGLSQTFLELTTIYLRSETLFLCVSLAALLVMHRAFTDGRLTTAVAAAVLVGIAIAVRMAGVALLAVPLARFAWPGPGTGLRARAVTVLLLGFLPLLAWQLRAASIQDAHPEAPDYRAEFWAAEPRDLTKTVRTDMPALDAAGMLRRVRGNLEVQARAMATLLTNVDRAAHRLPVGALLLAFVLAGAGVLWRQGGIQRDLTHYLLATLALYLVWPFNQLARFYAPLLPLLLLCGGAGIALALRAARTATTSRTGRALVLLTGAALLAVLALQHSDHPRWLGRYSTTYAALLATSGVAWLGALVWLGGGRALPAVSHKLAWALLLLFAGTFLSARFVDIPARAERFEARRAQDAVPPPLDAIDVHPLIERVALFLLRETAPDAVVMTDVPKMLSILSERRCVPFRYQVVPPAVIADGADFVFYTGELPDAAAVLRDVAQDFEVAAELTESGPDGERFGYTIYRAR